MYIVHSHTYTCFCNTKKFIKSERVYEYMDSVGHFNQVRKVNKMRLLEFIQQHKDEQIDRILGMFSLQTGMRVTTLRIYVEELKLAGLIE